MMAKKKRGKRGKHSKEGRQGQLNGEPCPRCGQATRACSHAKITEKHLSQPFYYSHWFYCENPSCKTTTIMPEAAKVLNRPALKPGDDIALDVLAEGVANQPPQEHTLAPLGDRRWQRSRRIGEPWTPWEEY